MISLQRQGQRRRGRRSTRTSSPAWSRRATPRSRCACCASGTCACASRQLIAPARPIRETSHASADRSTGRLARQEQVDRSTASASCAATRRRSARRCKTMVGDRGIRDMEQGGDSHAAASRTSPSRRSATAAAATARSCIRATSEYVARRPDRAAAGRRRRRRRQRQAGDGDERGRLRLLASREEFMQIFFDDLELPRPDHARSCAETPEWKSQRAGYRHRRHADQPARACARCAARWPAHRAGRRRSRASSRELEERARRAARSAAATPTPSIARARSARSTRCARGSSACPSSTRSTCATATACACPMPTTQGGDVLPDGRLRLDGRGEKDLAKRFFILLYLFLTRTTSKIDLVFIRHHTQAAGSRRGRTSSTPRETGGTVVSSALMLMDEIIARALPAGDWNIYGAQASDGDNWQHDSGRSAASSWTRSCCRCALLRLRRGRRRTEQNLWEEYAQRAPTRTATSRCSKIVERRPRSTRCSATCSRRQARHERRRAERDAQPQRRRSARRAAARAVATGPSS